MSKRKTKNVSWWKKKVDAEFSKYIRIRDALKTTGTIDKCVCCSCSRIYPSFGLGCLQAGHFIPGRGNSIRYEETCVHGQCYNCNLRLKGNWPGYYEFMLKQYGQEEIDKLLALKHKIRKFNVGELETMRDLYKYRYNWMKEHKRESDFLEMLK